MDFSFSLPAQLRPIRVALVLPLLMAAAAGGCGGATANGALPTPGTAGTGVLVLPTIPAMVREGERLSVLATTSMIGDVAGRVGGDAIDLTVLMQPGQDPHSYQPGAADLARAADADIVFVNGWDLEQALIEDLAAVSERAVLIPVSAGIEPLTPAGQDEADRDEGDVSGAYGVVDPHVWLDVGNVIRWIDSIQAVLIAADPANAEAYHANATAYRSELEQLDADIRWRLEAIPAERRVLVTNHDNLGYFAAAYGFEVIGTIIPSISTLAEPTAGDLGDLVELMKARDVCVLSIETTAGDQLIRALEDELTFCPKVHIVTLYADSLGPPGSGADTYAGMMAANAAFLVDGLSP